MPEKPEVITVAKKLKQHLVERTIDNVEIFHDNIIAYPSVNEFKDKIKNKKIIDVTTKGKWIVFDLGLDYLLVHLRMEGKFFYRIKEDPKEKHEHVIFNLDNGEQLRFHDVRKFGKMIFISKKDAPYEKPFIELGLEFDDEKLTSKYLEEKYLKKNLPIKTVLLDQSIITGIGNIYADEILFLSQLHPLEKARNLTNKNREDIIKYTREVLNKAILEGGTTIRSYTSEEGVHGLFQQHLKVHGKEKESCPECKTTIIKIKVGGRGTYYCPNCQVEKNEQNNKTTN